jgi:tRNA A37 methylthiotransferase MiaB
VRGLAINARFVDTTTEVLAEGPSLRNADRWSGRNPQNKIVVFDPPPDIVPGDLVPIHVVEVHPQTLFGDPTKPPR